MLSNFRAFAQSPLALVIIVLLVLSFAVYGVGGIFTGSGTAVAVVGNQQISVQETRQAFDSELRRIQTENPGFTREQAYEMSLQDQVMQRLITFASLAAKAEEMGLAVSEDAVLAEISEIPAFRNPVTNQYDPETARAALVRANITPESFQSDVEGDMLRRQLIVSLAGGIDVPRFLAETRVGVAEERRRIRAMLIDPSAATEIEAPDDETLQAFIENNADMRDPLTGLELFTAPEFRAITLVRFRVEDFSRDVEVDEAELRETYEYQVDTGALGTPAIRSFEQLTVADEATAIAAVEQLNQGTPAAEVALALGLDTPLVQEDVQAYEVPDETLSEAVFAMATGEARAVEGRFGWSAVVVTAGQDADLPSFEEQLPELRAAAARERAQDAMFDKIEAFEGARAGGASLEEAARIAGTPIEVFAPLDIYGRDQGLELDFQRYQTMGTTILPTAFEQVQGFATDLQDYNETDYFTVRVDEIIPSRPRELADVRDEAEARWRAIQVDNQLQAAAETALAQLEDGEDMDIVALTAGGRNESATLSRGETADNFGRNIVSRAFSLAPGEWTMVPPSGDGQYAIITVDEVIPAGEAELTAAAVDPVEDQLTTEMSSDILIALQAALLQEYSVGEDAVDGRLLATAVGQDPNNLQ